MNGRFLCQIQIRSKNVKMAKMLISKPHNGTSLSWWLLPSFIYSLWLQTETCSESDAVQETKSQELKDERRDNWRVGGRCSEGFIVTRENPSHCTLSLDSL